MTTEDERIRIIVDLVGEKAWKELERDAKRFAQTSQKVAQQSNAMSRETKVLTRNTSQLGNRLQNSAFQLGDFLVQVEAGVPATRAFGQQASQLLGAFGPWGAVLGVAAATVPILVSALADGEEQLLDTKEAIDQLQKSASSLGTTFQNPDFSGWLTQFAEIDATQRKALESLLNYEREVLRIRLSTAVESLGGGVPEDPGRGRFREGRRQELVFERAREAQANALGLTIRQFREFNEARRRFAASQFTDLDALGAMQQVVYGAQSGDVVNETLAATVKQMTEIANATTRLNAARNINLNDSLQPIVPQGRRVQDEFASNVTPGLNTIGNLPFPRDGVDDYEQHLKDLAAAQRQAAAELVASMQEIVPLGDEVFGSFTRNFDSMVAGIASGNQSIKDSFGNMTRAIIADLARLLAYRGVLALLGGPGTALGGAFAGQTGLLRSVTPFARGGVVSSPTMFPMSGGMGLAGEAGAEGIFPLGRLPNGDMGVKGPPMNITINNMAGVEVRATQSDGGLTLDIVRAAIAGDIARGGTPISQALSGSYGLQRAGI